MTEACHMEIAKSKTEAFHMEIAKSAATGEVHVHDVWTSHVASEQVMA